MEPKNKKVKLSGKSIEELNSCLYKKLNSDSEFTKRIDLEYDIWCMNLSVNFKYIVKLIIEYKEVICDEENSNEVKRIKGDEIIKGSLYEFINELFTFIVYLAIDSNDVSKRLLSPDELYKKKISKKEIIEKVVESINDDVFETKETAKQEMIRSLVEIYEDLLTKHSNNEFDTVLTQNENYFLITLLEDHDMLLSHLADKLSELKKTNYIFFIDDCRTQVADDDDLISFITNLKSHVNSSRTLYYKLENMHEKLSKQPIFYKNLFTIADRLFKNAENSISLYEKYQEYKEFETFDLNWLYTESYISTSATEKYFKKILSVLVNQHEYEHIHPYVKIYLMNENYEFDYKMSNMAHQKLTQDFKAFLLIIKLLQYCNILAYMLDCNRSELSLESFELLLKEYCKYSVYLVRCFVTNLIELLLNVRINEEDKFDFMQHFDQSVQLEILDYLNNICSLSSDPNINVYTDTAKLVFNFAKSLIKKENAGEKNEARTLKKDEFIDAKNFLTNAVKRVLKLIKSINVSFFQGINIMKLEVAKMLKTNVDRNIRGRSSIQECETMKTYLDVLIGMLNQLNKLKSIEGYNYKSPNDAEIALNNSVNVQDFCVFLFRSASILSKACVQVSKLLKVTEVEHQNE